MIYIEGNCPFTIYQEWNYSTGCEIKLVYQRVKSDIGHDFSCSFCRNESKDIFHVFRDCVAAKKKVWNTM